ncbi:hypothetical protein Trydic_g3965 [Trypoxylus dichotomus]
MDRNTDTWNLEMVMIYEYLKKVVQAGHELVQRAEIAIGPKEIALAAFLDTEGTLDRASFLSMERALQRCGARPTLTAWIATMLNNRTVHVSINFCSISATVAALLWCLLVDDLLPDLQEEGFYAQGYADDITIMGSERFGDVVSEKMQVELRLAETWCRKEGLNVNSSKTTTVRFTWRRRLRKLRCPSIFGSIVLVSTETKYLEKTKEGNVLHETGQGCEEDTKSGGETNRGRSECTDWERTRCRNNRKTAFIRLQTITGSPSDNLQPAANN